MSDYTLKFEANFADGDAALIEKITSILVEAKTEILRADNEKLHAELLQRDAIWLPEKDAEIQRLQAELQWARAALTRIAHDHLKMFRLAESPGGWHAAFTWAQNLAKVALNPDYQVDNPPEQDGLELFGSIPDLPDPFHETAPDYGHWIPVATMPDTDGDLHFVMLENGFITTEFYHFDNGWATDDDIAYWMPIPDKPESAALNTPSQEANGR